MTGIPATSLDLVAVPDPTITAGDEVLVAVEASGICGTDLHIMAGHSYRPAVPFVLGHEFAGRVVATGPDAEPWRGRRVVATPFEGCDQCSACRVGDARLCAQPRSIVGVVGREGAFATHVRLSARQLVELPTKLSSRRAAAVVDAGATAVNAARVARGADTRSAVVVGAGPVGALVCELLRRDGAEPVVVERNTRRRRLMESQGYAVAPDLAIPAQTPCVIDCSGAPGVPADALGALQARGLLVVAGYAIAAELDFAPVARKELTIRGVRSGSIEDLATILDLTATDAIAIPPIQSWPLKRINDALAALRAGQVMGKAVVDIEEVA